MEIEKFARYESFVFIGALMTLVVMGKLLGFYNISSDWFWLMAGVGLILEGLISFYKQKRFDNKYKIIEIKRGR